MILADFEGFPALGCGDALLGSAEGGDIGLFINKVKDKQSSIRLMGFGHRVYKNFDPRAKIIKTNARLTRQRSASG